MATGDEDDARRRSLFVSDLLNSAIIKRYPRGTRRSERRIGERRENDELGIGTFPQPVMDQPNQRELPLRRKGRLRLIPQPHAMALEFEIEGEEQRIAGMIALGDLVQSRMTVTRWPLPGSPAAGNTAFP